MNLKAFWKNKAFKIVVSFEALVLVIILGFTVYNHRKSPAKMVMGGAFQNQVIHSEGEKLENKEPSMNLEKFFRPSKLPAINDRAKDFKFFDEFYGKSPDKIKIPSELLKTPEDTIINYFSILKEGAGSFEEGKSTGCGTLGTATAPYPIAYNFLTADYRKKLSYKQYLESFKNIFHISLLKVREVPKREDHPDSIPYFIEIETIEGTDKGMGQFAYYYGFVYLTKEGKDYKISDVDFRGENYLCAPYHGWSYDAEAVVDIKYGNWCSLVKERQPMEQEGYVKKVPFKGTDGNEYLIKFFTLTNGTDVEVGQYKKNSKGEWEEIILDPEKCLEKKN